MNPSGRERWSPPAAAGKCILTVDASAATGSGESFFFFLPEMRMSIDRSKTPGAGPPGAFPSHCQVGKAGSRVSQSQYSEDFLMEDPSARLLRDQ